MNMEFLERVFLTTKYIAQNKYNYSSEIHAKSYLNSLRKELNYKQVDAARLLLDLFEREVNDFNAQCTSHYKKIENLKFIDYKGEKNFDSKYFKKINISKIKEAVSDNPNMTSYDIYCKFFKDNNN